MTNQNVTPTLADTRSHGYADSYIALYPANQVLLDLANSLIRKAGGICNFHLSVSNLLRRAYDEVIDMPRTGRWSIDQLEKTEKTYVGTKVEILIRHEFELSKGGRLDLLIDGHEVDVKNTLGNNWTIPEEAFGEFCLLVQGDEVRGRYSLGLVHALVSNLNSGRNRDKKATLSASGKQSIFWIIRNGQLPHNFFLHISAEDRQQILTQNSGAGRVRELFRRVRGVIIHRDIVCGVAQQKDPMKRLRNNGGARDALSNEGITLYSGKYDAAVVRSFGGPELGHDDFISFSSDEIEKLRSQLYHQ